MKLMKSIMILLLSLSNTIQPSTCPIKLQAAPEWSFLVYADPANDIGEAVFKNINDLVQAYDSSQVCFYVQFRVYLDKDPQRAFAWRYLVKNNSWQLVEKVKLTNDHALDLQNAIAWAFAQQQTKYHGLILSGHGSGILQPSWNQEKQIFENEPDDSQCVVCRRGISNNNRHMRSMLLNDFSGTFLSNAMIIDTMSFAKKLINKNVDILGLDMCMGACFEHAYQLAPYVNYLVGVQNCASADGFDFYALGKKMQSQDCTPRSLACDIVQSFGNYYQNLNPEFKYTLSALDLSHVAQLTSNLEVTAQYLMDLLKQYPYVHDEIMMVRRHSFHACIAPMYTDLYQILNNVTVQIADKISPDDAQKLQQLVSDVCTNVEQLVCANTFGKNINVVHGVNIYFPYSHIDSSYYRTPFAQNSSWLQFLEMIVA